MDSNLSFVFSSPRSGSTWLTRCINRHPDWVGTEFRLFGEFCEVWRDPSGNSVPRQTVDHFCRYFVNHLATPIPGMERDPLRKEMLRKMIPWLVDFTLGQTGKSRCLDKITPYLGTAKRVLKALEDYCGAAKLIHLVRDGRDVLISGAFDTHTRQGTLEGPLLDDEMVDQWAGYWVDTQQAIVQGRSLQLQILTVHYEEMLTDTAIVLKRIFEFLETRADLNLCRQIAEQESFARIQNRRQGDEVKSAKARKGIAGDWRNYLDQRSAQRFAERCQPWLQQYGYAANADWIQQCAPPE